MSNRKRGCHGRTITQRVDYGGEYERPDYVKLKGVAGPIEDVATIRVEQRSCVKSNSTSMHPARALREEGKRLKIRESTERKNDMYQLGRSINRVWSGSM